MINKTDHWIVHMDGDAFFASVEMAKNPTLRGKPIITGHERGIATALSYEAKALGVTRGMPVFQIRKLFPSVIVAKSDYDAYSLYSKRMINIVRRHLDIVEEYSIDECFGEIGNITDEKKLFTLGQKIKKEISLELGITVSLGISTSKSLAKIASKFKKPDGLTIIAPEHIDEYLAKVQIGNIWGIGRASVVGLREEGLETALDFKVLPREFIYRNYHKRIREIWHELHGENISGIESDEEDSKSISRSRSFTPTMDPKVIFAEISSNLEIACKRARKTDQKPSVVRFFLKTKTFRYTSVELILIDRTFAPDIILPFIREKFLEIFEPGTLYRATGISLSRFMKHSSTSRDLFGSYVRTDNSEEIFSLVDNLVNKFGENTIHLASTLCSVTKERSFTKKPLCIPDLGLVK